MRTPLFLLTGFLLLAAFFILGKQFSKRRCNPERCTHVMAEKQKFSIPLERLNRPQP